MVAAASPAGAAVVAIAVVVKLTRVLLLAPVVATVSVIQRVKTPAGPTGERARPPLVPLFVLGFLACVALRSTGVDPARRPRLDHHLQVAALGAALFGMGCSVKIASLFKKSGAVMVVSTLGTLFIGAVTLAGILRYRAAPRALYLDTRTNPR